MKSVGVFLMIISGIADIFAIAMVGTSSVESFKFVILFSSITFFIGFLLTVFGRPSSQTTDSTTTPQSNGGFDRLVADSPNQWCCTNCKQYNSNSVYYCTNCGERKKVGSTNHNHKPSTNEWKCNKCGRINQNYVGTCGCGMTKQNNESISFNENEETKTEATQSQNKVVYNTLESTADEIKKYKDLLDTGAITQEEYEAKKKQLLSL